MAKMIQKDSSKNQVIHPEDLLIAELDDRTEFSLGVVADSIVTLNGGCNGKSCTQNIICK